MGSCLGRDEARRVGVHSLGPDDESCGSFFAGAWGDINKRRVVFFTASVGTPSAARTVPDHHGVVYEANISFFLSPSAFNVSHNTSTLHSSTKLINMMPLPKIHIYISVSVRLLWGLPVLQPLQHESDRFSVDFTDLGRFFEEVGKAVLVIVMDAV